MPMSKLRTLDFLGEKFGLNFICREPRLHQTKTELKKLGADKNNNIIGAKVSKYTVKPVELLLYENHWMLYDDDITYHGKKYNTYQFLNTLINEGILKPMTLNDDPLSILNVKFI